MGCRFDRKRMREGNKSFVAIELNGTLNMGRQGTIPINRVLLLDSEDETVDFVEANVDLMIGIAIMARKMECSL